MSNFSEPPPLSCERCGHGMALVGRVPKLASHPELLTFRCDNCQNVQTEEAGGQD